VALADIHTPIFAVGTEWDHVAPWRSTYKINLQADAQVTYLLTNGGHNAGIVSEPGHQGRYYRVITKTIDQPYLDPDGFLERAAQKDGSWWLEWSKWLTGNSGAPVMPPTMGAPQSGYGTLGEAPGTYVLTN